MDIAVIIRLVKIIFLKERLLKYLFNVDYFVCFNICDYFSNFSIKVYIHHNIYDDPWVSSEKRGNYV